MIEVIVTVEYKGQHFNTNVIAHKDMSEDEIKNLAVKQVSKQWKELVA